MYSAHSTMQKFKDLDHMFLVKFWVPFPKFLVLLFSGTFQIGIWLLSPFVFDIKLKQPRNKMRHGLGMNTF